ncbi:MAG: sulfite exporter TauE/SafE family protein [Nitratireductor sp.]
MDLEFSIAILGVFLLAGIVKGVVGLGLPTVSLALLAVAYDLPTAMALLIAPSLVTNVSQALSGGHALPIIARIWPFLVMAGATVWIGSMALDLVDLEVLTAMLGVLLVIYALINMAGFRLRVPPHRETATGIAAGLVNGVLTGMTGSFAVPGVTYLQAIGLPRDMLIQAMGLLFAISTLGLGAALFDTPYMNATLAIASVIAVIPALIGMWLGQRLRRSLSEAGFRRYFFAALLLLGLYIIYGAIS